MKWLKQTLVALIALVASYQCNAYELSGNYCWMQHDFRLIMPANGTAKIDNYFPSLRDAIVAGIEEAKTDFLKEAANNCKTDVLFLYDPAKQNKLLGKILITSEIACKTVNLEKKK